MNSICIITSGYPTPTEPTKYTFVDQLACAWADMGMNISVICPVPLFAELKNRKRFYRSMWERYSPKGVSIQVLHPRYFSASDRRIVGISTVEASASSYISAVRRAMKAHALKPDMLYSHFLPSGCCAGELGEQLHIPSFCAFGESSLWSIEKRNMDTVRKQLAKLTGIVSVSTENKRILIEEGLYRAENIQIFPNGVNHQLFYPRDKDEMRRKLHLPENEMIGVFTGSFSADKGVLNAQVAARQAGNTKMLFIGGGCLKPEGDNILFCGKLPHDQIPDYLSAADFFILPTKAEGCCNAIIEAMACGLPIISTNGKFNDDILNNSYSIRIDPNDIESLSDAVRKLTVNKMQLSEMGRNALQASVQFDVYERARKILQYMLYNTPERNNTCRYEGKKIR